MTLDLQATDEATLSQAARTAHDARDWRRAAQFWAQVRVQRPDDVLAYSDGAVALYEDGEPGAAEALIGEALTRFPQFTGAAVVWADLAMRRRDWAEANRRWAEVRRRFPGDGHGYVQGSAALMQLGRTEDADALLGQGHAAMPTNSWLTASWASFAQQQRKLEEALRRWAEMRDQASNHPIGFTGAASALRDLGRHLEADAMLAGALARFPDNSGPLIDWAMVADASGDSAEAVRRWEVVRTRFPDTLTGYTAGANALRAAGRAEDADTLMTAALSRFTDNVNLFIEQSRAATARQDWDEADRRWARTRELFPGEAIGYIEGARVLIHLNRTDAAEVVISMARQRFPADRAVAHAWADLALRRRDWPECAARWLALRGQFPDDPSVVTEASRALQEAGRVDEAEALLADAMLRFPNQSAIALAWAEIAVRRQIWPEAIQRWATIRERFSDHPFGYVEGARALQHAGRTAEAEQLLGDATRRFPSDVSIRVGWADLAGRRADWVEAHRRWEETRRLFQHEVRAWVESANALSSATRVDEADALFEEALQRFPANLDVMFAWALLATRARSSETTQERWRRVRDAFPNHTQGYVFGAYALQDSGRPADAEVLIAEALQRFPAEMEVLRAAGEIAFRRGELALAAERFQAAAARFPGDISLARRCVESLGALQRQDEALGALDAALRIWPLDPDFLRRRVMLDIQTGRVEEAFARWRTAIADPGIAAGLGHELAWAMFGEGLPEDMAREVLLFLAQERDTGERQWLPRVAGFLQLRGIKPHLANLAINVVRDFGEAPHDPATLDVLRSSLLFEYSDDDMRRFLRDYVSTGRVALTAFLFCQNYWKAKNGMFERFTQAFRDHMAEKWRDLSWFTAEGASEILAYLNFAAVHAHDEYAHLVHRMRERLDLPAMQAQGLHSIPGVVGNIGLLAKIEPLASPTIAARNRRLRVALCVSGQLRGYQRAFATWRNLALDGHDVSVFVHVWKAVGRNWQRIWFFSRTNPFLWDTLVGPGSIAFLRDRYPRLAAAAEATVTQNNDATEAELTAFYGTPHVRIEDDTRDQFVNRHNLWKMHYKVQQAHRLALEDGRDFDLMIRLRPDREFLAGKVPDWHAIRSESEGRRVVFTDSPYLFTERQTWLGDQFACGTSDVMDVYSGVFGDMEGFARTGLWPPDVPDHIRPHTNLFYLSFYRGLLGKMMPDVSFGALLDPAMLSVQDVLSLARQDVAERPLDDFDRQFFAACEAALR